VLGLAILRSMSLLNQRLIFDPQVLNLCFSLRKLNCNLVSLVFDGFVFGQENVSVDLDFLLSFLHCHLKLVLFIFKSVDMVCGFVETLFDLLNLKFHNVVFDQHILFLLSHLGQCLYSHVIFKRKFLNLGRKLLFRALDFSQLVFNSTQVLV
jgi:hypothetical protein